MASGGMADLLVALGSTFSVVLLGYILRRAKVITGDHASGIGRLTARICLPSLLFLSMATIDFSGVSVAFVAAILLARFG
jgi:predicted permease